MFNPSRETRTSAHVRPQDDLPRLSPDPEAAVPGFNIAKRPARPTLPRPRKLGSAAAAQDTADPLFSLGCRRSLALAAASQVDAPWLRWKPAGGLAVGPTETTGEDA